MEDTKVQQGKSFISAYLENPALDVKDIVGMACDMLLAGVDTVNTIIHIITNISKHYKASLMLKSNTSYVHLS